MASLGFFLSVQGLNAHALFCLLCSPDLLWGAPSPPVHRVHVELSITCYCPALTLLIIMLYHLDNVIILGIATGTPDKQDISGPYSTFIFSNIV